MNTYNPVCIRRESVRLPTYYPEAADKNPMFFEKRVYQGSNGKVYPLPFIDRISQERKDREWDAITLENDFLELMILPQIGGRIHMARDKANGYDFIYLQPSIKPSLVGLAGPWISGGIEFNWPQHHRPSTFMPTDAEIETHPDGSVTVWLSEHDPMERMKGMHGVCLSPDSCRIEIKVRVYNRTQDVKTFLWWTNIAAAVDEHYQSLFPQDVHYVADHAKRAMSRFPLSDSVYYGINYGERASAGVPEWQRPARFAPTGEYAANDLSWYSNIPVPTSYMCMGTNSQFAGGYDHAADAGFVHVCNPHISPGKKQWTWGNHAFGYAWDRNLSDDGRPYIEVMAGVYTDNQPDFSFLQPGESRSWSQFIYPVRQIGPVHEATDEIAVHMRMDGGIVHLGILAAVRLKDIRLALSQQGREVWTEVLNVQVGETWKGKVDLPGDVQTEELRFVVYDQLGHKKVTCRMKGKVDTPVPEPVTEPPLPEEIHSMDELYLTGLHLEQYRHATRTPQDYWIEALRRDPGDARCCTAMGRWHLRRGEFDQAETYLRKAIERLTLRNPNPYTVEAFYELGQTLRHKASGHGLTKAEREALKEEAYGWFYKATWKQDWAGAAFHCIAEMDAARGEWVRALEHIDRCLCLNAENLNARNLKAGILRMLDMHDEADECIRQTLALDPLDWWALDLAGHELTCDNQVRLDLAICYARAGMLAEAEAVLAGGRQCRSDGSEPLLHYYRAWIAAQRDLPTSGLLSAALQSCPDYCFPARLEEIAILEFAIDANRSDFRACYFLGNLFFDRRRHHEAIHFWQEALARLGEDKDPVRSICLRNLGMAYYNICKSPQQARSVYDAAVDANPDDARLCYERDQLHKLLGVPVEERFRQLEQHIDLVERRDDLVLEYATLLNIQQKHEMAVAILNKRRFQPWEGGEGLVLAQWVRAHLGLGRNAMRNSNVDIALEYFHAALFPPENLAEARHLLANASEIYFWLGEAFSRAETKALHGHAVEYWSLAASAQGDFQSMQVQPYSEVTIYSARALSRLGKKGEAEDCLRRLLAYSYELEKQEARINYFATSLPTMLLFEDDLNKRQRTHALFLRAQALQELGQVAEAMVCLQEVLDTEPAHLLANEMLWQGLVG